MSKQQFIDRGNGIIFDPATNLEWTKDTIAVDVKLYEAEKAVAALGDGWRMPTRQELETLLDLELYSPAINTAFFPDTKIDGYWTSTPCAWNKPARWVVSFRNGQVYGSGLRWCVRAVSSGQ